MRFVVKPCTLAHLHWKTTSSDQFWYSHWSLFWSLVIIFFVCVLRRPQNLLHSFGIQWRTTRATKKCFQHIMMNLRCIGEITRKILLNYELNLNESFLRSPVAQRTIFRNRNSLKEKKSLGKIVNHGKKIILSSFLSWRKFTTEPQLHVLDPAFLASVKTYPLLINYVHHVFIRASET